MLRSRVKSAGRVLEILEFFADRRRPATLGDVSRSLGYPSSSACMLLRSLVGQGYLTQDPATRCFMPTIRVAMLGGWIASRAQARDLTDVMQRLRSETGRTVILAMQHGIDAIYVGILPGEDAQNVEPHTGTRRPICRVATGHLLLSGQPPDSIGRIVRRTNAEAGPSAPPLRATELQQRLETCRRHGFAVTVGTLRPGRGQIAVALPTPPGQPPLSLGLGGPLDQVTTHRDAMLTALRAAVSGMERWQ